jgi:Tol biopolymer transport system component
MASDPADRPRPGEDPGGPQARDRLDSWKEIADYLKRDVRTVQRWEEVEGLPVHRHFHRRRGSPYAVKPELDEWRRRREALTTPPSMPVNADPAPSGPPSQGTDAAVGRPRLSSWVALLILSVALGIAVAGITSSRRARPVLETVRFAVYPPKGMAFAGGPALSPDGRQLAVVIQDPSGQIALWARRLDALEFRRLPGTDGANHPFWDPYSRELAFFADGKLKRVALAGGAPKNLIDVEPGDHRGSWGLRDEIVFSIGPRHKLYRVAAAGGPATPLPRIEQAGSISGVEPLFLPDGRHYLFYVNGADAKQAGIFVGSIDSGERTRLLDHFHSQAAYSPDGRLLFVQNRVLIAQPFDITHSRLSGAPTPLEEYVSSFSVAQNDTLAFTKDVATELAWFDRTGRQIASIQNSDGLGNPALSPDDSRIAANRRVTIGRGIWLIDVTRAVASRFTVDSSFQPVWSPDGRDIVFSSGGDLYRRSVDGAGEAELLLKTPDVKFPHDWSPDRRSIVYVTNNPITHWDMWLLPLSGDRTPIPFLRTEFSEFSAQVSPDGRWVAYVSDESGNFEVFVQSFPVPGNKRRVSAAGGTEPKWRRDGRELFYLAPDRSLMAASVSTVQRLDIGMPKLLFRTHAGEVGGRNRYAVSADGQRFLIESQVSQPASTSITVVLNWPTALLATPRD